MSNIREIFYNTRGQTDYASVLEQVRKGVLQSVEGRLEDLREEDRRDKIAKYIIDYNIKCNITDSVTELTDHIYHDMSGLSFISREKLFEMPGFEELNINAWNDVDLVVSGITKKTDYRFLSPQHAIDIHLRMLQKTNTIMDPMMPRAIADLGRSIRICVLQHPIVDRDVGVVSSIRKVNTSTVDREFLIEKGTVSNDILDFLLLCLRHGVSVCTSGETGSGKTTLTGALISLVAETLRTVTIEEGSREWYFVKRNDNGEIINSVVHLKTRPNEEDSRLNIDQKRLIMDSLRLDPEFLAIGEVRGEEAAETMGACNTGHTVITTLHANSALDSLMRLVTLAKKAYDMSDHTLLTMAVQAFPIMVHIEKLADNTRRVTEIVEVEGYQNGDVIAHTLFEFEVEDNVHSGDGSIQVQGHFVQRSGISRKLAHRLLKKGARKADIDRFAEREEKCIC